MPLSFEEVAAACVARSRRWHPGGVEEWSIADWAVAAAGESLDPDDFPAGAA